MLFTILSGCGDKPIFILLGLLGFFGVIVIVVILLRKYAKPFKSDEKPKSSEEIANEEVNRILQPIEDEKTAEEVNNFKETAVNKDDEEGEDKPILK